MPSWYLGYFISYSSLVLKCSQTFMSLIFYILDALQIANGP